MRQKLLVPKIILLVGMMGAGKTSVGRIVAKKLGLPFIDSDKEIEKITGFSISDLFARYGEKEFRIGEEKIMERLLKGKPCVLSSGGGAFLSEKTRARGTTIRDFHLVKSRHIRYFQTHPRAHAPAIDSVGR